MTRAARPSPVRRFLHRPRWWALGVVAFAAVELTAQALEVRVDDARFADAVVVTADASPAHPDTGVVDVRFASPVDGAPVEAAMVVRSAYDGPLGGPVQLEVSRTDPTLVRLPTEARSLDELPLLAALLAVPLLSALLRRAHVRAVERLMAAPGPSYAMVGALVPPGGVHRRWRLALYPVDAGPGAEPVGTVELLAVPVPVADALPVEVKGEPRPFGLLVARSGDDVLWPRGRGLGAGTRVGRPLAIRPLPPATPATVRLPTPAGLIAARVLRLAGVLLLLAFAAATDARTWADEQQLIHSRPVTVTADAPAGPAGGASGALLAYRQDRDDPSVRWSADQRGPADPASDLLLGLTVVLVPFLLVADALLRRVALDDLARAELAATGRIDRGEVRHVLPPPRPDWLGGPRPLPPPTWS